MLFNNLHALRPFRTLLLNHANYIRPIIKLAKDKFQLTLDVCEYCKEEIRVKARPEFVVVEGKQERKIENGYVVRKFVRKYKLPPGCDPNKVYSTLSEEGILTVTAPRDSCGDINMPCEIPVPIKLCGSHNKKDPQCMQVEPPNTMKSLCDYYLKRDNQGDKKNKPSGQDGCGCDPPQSNK